MTRPIVLAAGGTGGHLFPAEALARALVARGQAVALVTDLRGKAFGSDIPGVETHRVPAGTIGAGVGGKAKGLIAIGRGVLAARRLLKRLDPQAVVGFGGYPSLPTVLAAGAARIPVIVHEQNAVLGRANRIAVRRARAVATSFPSVQFLPDAVPATLTGNPVRPVFAGIGPYAAPSLDGRFEILVLGGSQGARALSETVPAALALLPERLRGRLSVVQQCRAEDLDAVRARYAATGIAAELQTFFADVPVRLAACHLLIARAGASTIAELALAGRPAILVPYPFATDDHQTRNARALAAAGAAWVMPQGDLTPAALAPRIESLAADPTALAGAAAAARGWGRPDAAERLADLVLSTAGAASPARSPSSLGIAA